MVGKMYFELVAPEDRPCVTENQRQVLQQGMVKDVPFTGLKLNGEKFAGEVSLSKLEDSAGNLSGFVGITKDVTDRKQAEDALRASEERLREVLENSLDAVYKRDLRTNSYVYFSSALTRLSGYTPDEMKTLPRYRVVLQG